MHTSYDRHRTGVDRLQHCRQSAGVSLVFFDGQCKRSSHPGDVRTRGERRAIAGEHYRPQCCRWLIGQLAEGRMKVGDELGVERVADFRAGEDDPGDRAIALDSNCGAGPHHRRPRR
jgi:hypothetical protein